MFSLFLKVIIIFISMYIIYFYNGLLFRYMSELQVRHLNNFNYYDYVHVMGHTVFHRRLQYHLYNDSPSFLTMTVKLLSIVSASMWLAINQAQFGMHCSISPHLYHL